MKEWSMLDNKCMSVSGVQFWSYKHSISQILEHFSRDPYEARTSWGLDGFLRNLIFLLNFCIFRRLILELFWTFFTKLIEFWNFDFLQIKICEGFCWLPIFKNQEVENPVTKIPGLGIRRPKWTSHFGAKYQNRRILEKVIISRNDHFWDHFPWLDSGSIFLWWFTKAWGIVQNSLT